MRYVFLRQTLANSAHISVYSPKELPHSQQVPNPASHPALSLAEPRIFSAGYL